MLDDVETQWKTIMGYGDSTDHPAFMQFEEREGIGADDDNDDGF